MGDRPPQQDKLVLWEHMAQHFVEMSANVGAVVVARIATLEEGPG